MQYYTKNTETFLKIPDLNNIINFTDFEKNKIILDCKNPNIWCSINSIQELICFYDSSIFEKIQNVTINYELIDYEEVQTLFFIDKYIFVCDNNLNDEKYQKIMLNPTIYGICKISEYFENNYKKFKCIIEKQIDIVNDICHINILKIQDYLKPNGMPIKDLLKEKFILVFRKFLIYHIHNFPDNISDSDINNIYDYLSASIGIPVSCLPVNDITVSKTISRDIKYDPFAKTLHFYTSNSRQPLHNDYSHYPAEISPDWLILYCLESSEYGGFTSLVTNKLLKEIMIKYEPQLFEKVNNEINYLYIREEGNIIHPKILFDKINNISNWNFFQIYNDYNNKNILDIREQFAIFLNKNITEGRISTLTKKWKKGDCIIFNDHFVMHERSSFYGSRHLKDMHLKDNNINLK
jgi:hypothetical protein